MSCIIFPSLQTTLLSSTKQLLREGCIVLILVPFGSPLGCIFNASTNGRMSSSAFPIESSMLNVSWSYTSMKTGSSGLVTESVKSSFHSGFTSFLITRVFILYIVCKQHIMLKFCNKMDRKH